MGLVVCLILKRADLIGVGERMRWQQHQQQTECQQKAGQAAKPVSHGAIQESHKHY